MAPDNVSLAGFIQFCKTQSGTYSYLNRGECAFAKYLKSLGYEKVEVGGWEYSVGAGRFYPMTDIHEKLDYCIAYPERTSVDAMWTYAGLVLSLEALS